MLINDPKKYRIPTRVLTESDMTVIVRGETRSSSKSLTELGYENRDFIEIPDEVTGGVIRFSVWYNFPFASTRKQAGSLHKVTNKRTKVGIGDLDVEVYLSVFKQFFDKRDAILILGCFSGSAVIAGLEVAGRLFGVDRNELNQRLTNDRVTASFRRREDLERQHTINETSKERKKARAKREERKALHGARDGKDIHRPSYYAKEVQVKPSKKDIVNRSKQYYSKLEDRNRHLP